MNEFDLDPEPMDIDPASIDVIRTILESKSGRLWFQNYLTQHLRLVVVNTYLPPLQVQYAGVPVGEIHTARTHPIGKSQPKPKSKTLWEKIFT